jgi:hypothetical protein
MPRAGSWVFLVTNFEPSVKTNSFVGVSDDPVVSLAAKRAQKPLANNESWRLEIVIGPFTAAAAAACGDSWRTMSRGISSRRRKGYELHAALRGAAGGALCIFDAQVAGPAVAE